jgi:hypothetical protein
LRFVETPVFTRQIGALLAPEEFRALQLSLVFRPGQGAVVGGSGGLRKLRWGRSGMGKRGGCRVLYFWHEGDGVIYLLFAFSKNDREDLTTAQVKVLRRAVEEEFE